VAAGPGVRAGAGVVAGLDGAVADGVLGGAAAGVAGWLPQPASVTGTTAIASAAAATVLRAGFMASLLGRGMAELAALRLPSSLDVGQCCR
jgi:hypothetical protein